MDCSTARSRIEPFLAGDLAEPERQRLREHFLACQQCRNELAVLDRIGRGFAALRTGAPHPAERQRGVRHDDRFFDQLQEDCLLASQTAAEPQVRGRVGTRSSFALVAVLVLGLSLLFDRGQDALSGSPGPGVVGVERGHAAVSDAAPEVRSEASPERARTGLLARLEALREARDFDLARTVPVRQDAPGPQSPGFERGFDRETDTSPVGVSDRADEFWARPIELQSRLEDLRRRDAAARSPFLFTLEGETRDVGGPVATDSVDPLRSLCFDRPSRRR